MSLKNTHIHTVKKNFFSFPSCPLEEKIICVIVPRCRRGDIFSIELRVTSSHTHPTPHRTAPLSSVCANTRTNGSEGHQKPPSLYTFIKRIF